MNNAIDTEDRGRTRMSTGNLGTAKNHIVREGQKSFPFSGVRPLFEYLFIMGSTGI